MKRLRAAIQESINAGGTPVWPDTTRLTQEEVQDWLRETFRDLVDIADHNQLLHVWGIGDDAWQLYLDFTPFEFEADDYEADDYRHRRFSDSHRTPGTQRTLFSGLDCLPGQMDLFDDLDRMD